MDSHTTEHLAGGAIRVSVNSATPEEALQAHHETNRVHRGVVRSDGTGQHVQHSMETPQYAGSVMATLRNSAGGQRIDSTATVDVGGMRTSLRNAVELGYLVETGPGQYADAPQRPQEKPEGHQQDTLPAPELAAPQAEADWAADIEPLPQPAFDAAAAASVTAVLDETSAGWEKAATVLAQSSGLSPDRAAEYIEAGYSFYEGQVSKMAEGLGISEEQRQQWYDHMRTHEPAKLQAATQQLVTLRRLDGFRELATSFKVRSGNSQLAQWRSMGFDAFTDRDTGEVMVSRDDGRPIRARDLGNA